MTPREQAHFKILNALAQKPDLTQRELADEVGLSLGQTHYLLRALLGKGALKLSNFYRSERKFNKVMYLLTSEGIRDRAQLMHLYLARKRDEYVALKAEIEMLEMEALKHTDMQHGRQS